MPWRQKCNNHRGSSYTDSRRTWPGILGIHLSFLPSPPCSVLKPYWINANQTQAQMTHCSLHSRALIEAYLSLRTAVLPMRGMRRRCRGKQTTTKLWNQSDSGWNRSGCCYDNSFSLVWLLSVRFNNYAFFINKDGSYYTHTCQFVRYTSTMQCK